MHSKTKIEKEDYHSPITGFSHLVGAYLKYCRLIAHHFLLLQCVKLYCFLLPNSEYMVRSDRFMLVSRIIIMRSNRTQCPTRYDLRKCKVINKNLLSNLLNLKASFSSIFFVTSNPMWSLTQKHSC